MKTCSCKTDGFRKGMVTRLAACEVWIEIFAKRLWLQMGIMLYPCMNSCYYCIMVRQSVKWLITLLLFFNEVGWGQRTTRESIVVVHRNYMTGADTLNIYLAFCSPQIFCYFRMQTKIQLVDLQWRWCVEWEQYFLCHPCFLQYTCSGRFCVAVQRIHLLCKMFDRDIEIQAVRTWFLGRFSAVKRVSFF